MKISFIFRIILWACFLFPALYQTTYAQAHLERISVTERSDGKGFVLRYHLTERADSFHVFQPSPDLIQMRIYATGMDTVNFIPAAPSEALNDIRLYRLRDGFGIDIHPGDHAFFRTAVYNDKQSSDLLLALENITETEAERITGQTEPVSWADMQLQDSSRDNNFLHLRENRKFNTIILNAGHGGHDPGTVNRSLGLREKDIVLAVTLKVGKYIEEHLPGVDVIYTRTDDSFVDLDERGLTATRAKADLFVSIHANAASSPGAYGTEIFFLGLARSQSALEVMKRENSVTRLEENNAPSELSEEELLIYELANSGNIAMSERIATMIEDQFKNRAQRRSRGVKQAGFMELWHASTPAVLVELGFLSNPQEGRYLASEYGQDVLASGIFRAIRNFKEEHDKSMSIEPVTVQNE